MEDLKDMLGENADFYREQERKIAARLALLAKGRIRSKKIGGKVYYYLQYRKGRSVKTEYIGKDVPRELRESLAERDRLEKELPRVREGLRLFGSARGREIDLAEPLLAIFRGLTEQKLWDAGFEIIGSWCFLLYQKHLPMEKYPLRTEDLDFLVPRPFKGRAFDLGGFLEELGFSRHFNPDGSMFFTGNRMKIEFLSRERRNGTLPPRHIKEIGLTPQELRFLDILFIDPLVLKLGRGIRAKVPNPSAFLLHKLFIAERPERRNKREKDIRQGIYTGKYVLAEKSETARLSGLWGGLPVKWKARIRQSLTKAVDIVPLESGVIRRLQALLRIGQANPNENSRKHSPSSAALSATCSKTRGDLKQSIGQRIAGETDFR